MALLSLRRSWAAPTATKPTIPTQPSPLAQSGQRRQGLEMAASPIKTQRSNLTETLAICTDDDPDQSTQFVIYGYIITTSTCSVLKTLFKTDKAREKGVVLHDTHADILRGYVHWLHTRRLISRKGKVFRSCPELVNLYLVGETLKDPTFCQEVVEAMVIVRYEFRKWPGHVILNDVWERTSPKSPLRKVMKELWMSTSVYKAMGFLKTAPEPGYPKDLVLGLLDELVGRSVLVKEATFSGKCRKEVESACRNFLESMATEDDQ